VRKKERNYLPTLRYGDIVMVKDLKEIAVVREEFIGANGHRRIAVDVGKWNVIVTSEDNLELLNKRTAKDVWKSENKKTLFQAAQK